MCANRLQSVNVVRVDRITRSIDLQRVIRAPFSRYSEDERNSNTALEIRNRRAIITDFESVIMAGESRLRNTLRSDMIEGQRRSKRAVV